MSVELRPLGVPCNIRCQYCYQNPQRDAAPAGPPYDLAAMKAAIEAEGGPFGLFGGEPLLVPDDVLEDLFAWGLLRFGENGIQTNGTLISDYHIELFAKYRVRVGISVDGPGALNDARWAGTLELTRAATEKTHAAIARLCRAGNPPSLIVTLHRGNASAERIELLADWLGGLPALGVKYVRLHLLEVEDEEIRRKYALSTAENLDALRRLQHVTGCQLDVFVDMDRMLQGNDRTAACVFRACDPYTTAAVRGVEGQGQRSNCGRTNKDGIEFGKASEAGYERYLALYQTPQEVGGCQGCRFFLMCKGHCPGTAIAGDWRNRSEHCEVYKDLFSEREQESLQRGEEPLSLSPLRQRVEQAMLAEWARGDNPALASVRGQVERGLAVAEQLSPRRRPVRICWVSESAQKLWEPRIARIQRALAEVTWRSATTGLRACAVIRLPPQELAARERELLASGHALRLLDPRTEQGELREHQVAIGEQGAVLALRAAWNGGDVQTVGQLLGYPACCVRAYAEKSTPTAIPFSALDPWLNTLWRPLGLHGALHHVCTPGCQESIDFVARLLQKGRELGFGAELDWLQQLLSWPVDWSSLHGIAEVRTPILKFTYWTAYTAQRAEVRIAGSDYPPEGAHGLRFPYQRPEHLKVSDSRGHKRGLLHPIATPGIDVSVTRLRRHGPR